jgi:hypothetical protein
MKVNLYVAEFSSTFYHLFHGLHMLRLAVASILSVLCHQTVNPIESPAGIPLVHGVQIPFC